jgi:hypothetical protein
MGTRNLRIRPQQLDEQWPSLQGKQLHVVTLEGITFTGKAIALSPAVLTVQDSNSTWYNRKKHTHNLARNSIQEVILDLITPH